jgi:hypothetical protein
MMRSAEERESRASLLTAASIDDTNSSPHAAGKQAFGARLCRRARHVLLDIGRVAREMLNFKILCAGRVLLQPIAVFRTV